MMAVRCVWACLAWCCAWPVVAAELHTPISAQEKLEAIKANLIATTLKSPTTVHAISWVDVQGQLHELSVFKSQLPASRVQAKSYERKANGEVQAMLEVVPESSKSADSATPSSQPLGRSGATAEMATCSDHSGPNPWRHALHLVYQPDARLNPAVGKELVSAFRQMWLEQAPQGQAWMMVPDLKAASLSNTMTPYEKTLLGLEMGQQPWRVVLQAKTRRVEAPDPLTWPASEPWMEVHLSLRLMALDRAQSAREWQTAWKMPIEFQAWAPGALTPENQAKLRQQVMQLTQQLDAWLQCEPFQPRVLKAKGNELIIDAGQASGVKLGDEWLIAQDDRFRRDGLQGHSLETLTLAKVTAVGRHTSALAVMAGPAAAVQVNHRAFAAQDWIQVNPLPNPREQKSERVGQRITNESEP